MRDIEFKDFVTLQRGFDLPEHSRVNGEVPVVASTSISGFHNVAKVSAPGVVTGRSGALGEVQYIDKDFWPLNTTLWVKDFKNNEPKYVYYLLKTLDLKRFNSGAGVPTLNRNDLDTLKIQIHEKNEQKIIAKVLSNYDDLIENNNKRIKILEEMAQKIYKEWFVDFKFPNHETATFKQTDLGKIPSDWEVVLVESLLKRLKAKNKYTQDNVSPQGKIVVIDQSTSDYLGFHDNLPDFIATPEQPLIIFGDHTCKMQMLVEDFSIGPNVIPITSDNVPIAFLYYLIDSLIETKEYKRHWNDLIAKKVILPSKALTLEFSQKITPLMAMVNHLKHKNQTLKQTRDLLLPRLISGEIDVEDMEIK